MRLLEYEILKHVIIFGTTWLQMMVDRATKPQFLSAERLLII